MTYDDFHEIIWSLNPDDSDDETGFLDWIGGEEDGLDLRP